MTDKQRRRIIRKGDVVVTYYQEEMETLVCPTCVRPFCVAINLVTKRRENGDSIWCPVGHIIALKAAGPRLTERR